MRCGHELDICWELVRLKMCFMPHTINGWAVVKPLGIKAVAVFMVDRTVMTEAASLGRSSGDMVLMSDATSADPA
jgi:hypothetical protein